MGDMNTIPRRSDLNSVSSMNILTFLVFSFLFVSIHSQDNVQRCRGSSVKGRCSGQSNNGTICQIKDEHGDNPTMTCDGEHKLKQGTLLKNFPKLGKEWTLSLEFKPTEKPDLTKSNIIKLGDSIPKRIGLKDAGIFSIWSLQGQNLNFFGTHGDKKWSKKYNGTTQVGSWTKISFSQQSQKAQKKNCLKYQQVIKVNGEEISSRINKAPRKFEQVEVYASASSWKSQPGVIRNFELKKGHTGPIYGTSNL